MAQANASNKCGAGQTSIRPIASKGSQEPDAQGMRRLERSLREFLRIKTVSRDPELKEDCFRGAKYLCSKLEALGEQGCCTVDLALTSYTFPSLFPPAHP